MMNQNQSGKQKSVSDRLDEINQQIREYYQGISLRLHPHSKVDQYLNLNEDDLKILDIEQIAIISSILAQYAIFLQKELNWHTKIINWCETNIQIVISDELKNNQEKFVSSQEKRIIAIKQNTAAMKLMEVKSSAQLYVDSLTSLSQRVEFYSKSLSNLQIVKSQLLKTRG